MTLTTSLRALAAGALLAGVGTTLTGTPGTAGASAPAPPTSHALFVETGQVTGNRILSYTRGSDGSVSFTGAYATGGKGAIEAGATADPLGSQGGLALINGGRDLVAVNPGSNTVSLFSVAGTSLHLVQTISSRGVFPTSAAVDGSTVAVLNAGNAGDVALFSLTKTGLVVRPGQVRSLGLDNTDPPNYLSSPGQVGFTPNGRHLIVTTKNSTSSFEVFNVGPSGGLSTTAVVTPSVTPVPFAFQFDPAGQLVAAEAGASSVTTYNVNTNGSLSPIGTVADGASALCWITGIRGIYYGSNAGSATVSSFSLTKTGAPVFDSATAAATHPGTTDSAASPDGNFLYVESGGSGALDAFAVSATGSLTPVETIWNIPVGSEGIAAS